MKIESLQELKEIIQTCRKLGVDSIKLGDTEFHLGHLPTKLKRYRKPKSDSVQAIATPGVFDPGPIETIEMPDELTEEQLLEWSAKANG